jgi:hypothetical protein
VGKTTPDLMKQIETAGPKDGKGGQVAHREMTIGCPSADDGKGGKVIFPFGPCIYATFITDKLKKSLLKEGNKIRKKEEHNFSSKLAGNLYFGGSYNYSDEYIDTVQEELTGILFQWFDFMTAHYGPSRLNFVPGRSKFGIGIENLWVNYQKRYDHNPNHQHNGIVSFVIYLKVPEVIFQEQADSNVTSAGHIFFKYGESISPLSVREWDVTPADNMVLMFPATLDHSVHPFWVEAERVSVSGNFTIPDTLISNNGI